MMRSGKKANLGDQPIKVTVVLANRHLVFLDRLSASVRERHGVSLQRAEVIRALVDALEESGLDLGRVDLSDPQTRESNLKALFASKLGR